MFLIGYDIGSSSVKASVIDAATGKCLASTFSPKKEMGMLSVKPGWAEQDPELWWKHLKLATRELLKNRKIKTEKIQAIGISYQMHGLVAVDKNQKVLRPSIIWCDSRAVEIGELANKEMGESFCLEHYLNSPGNFTASKLKWVKENESGIFEKIDKVMLPGDYIAMRMSGEINTTISGLSEGILWDYKNNTIAQDLLAYYSITNELIPPTTETFSVQAQLSSSAAKELGLKAGTKISYRAGDQPNNAFSLNVLNPGEIAATAGTSGVIYGITDKALYDSQSRVNTFVHVNNTATKPSNGVLLCVNGTGILNSWLKKLIGANYSYQQMNMLAAKSAIGSEGLLFYPYGNGAERTLGNKNIGAGLKNLQLNTHQTAHVLRAAQEGIAFALNYGFDIMKNMGLNANIIRAGHANMFLSPLFAQTLSNTTGCTIELYNTDGSQGAARGAGLGAGIYKSEKQAFAGLKKIKTIIPDKKQMAVTTAAYENWKQSLTI